jgi:hypothetical protein
VSAAVSILRVTHPSMARRLALLSMVAGLIVTGCSDGYRDFPEARAARVGTTSDINPRDPATLRDGGNLRLALTSFPPNFNVLNIDGNTADLGSVVSPTLPGAFITQADGSLKLNTDYFTGVELTDTNPQVVTYTINPKVVWSDGTPLTWEDLKSEVDACSGRDKRYLIASRAGFERVKSVTRGVDDRQAVITFAQPYSEWRGMFAGGMQPRSMTVTPEVFNRGQVNPPSKTCSPNSAEPLSQHELRKLLQLNPIPANTATSSWPAPPPPRNRWPQQRPGWDDPAINAPNAGTNLPSVPIHVIFRSDKSGNSFKFQQHLQAASDGAWDGDSLLVVTINFLGLRHVTVAILERMTAGPSVVSVSSLAAAGYREHQQVVAGLLNIRNDAGGYRLVPRPSGSASRRGLAVVEGSGHPVHHEKYRCSRCPGHSDQLHRAGCY